MLDLFYQKIYQSIHRKSPDTYTGLHIVHQIVTFFEVSNSFAIMMVSSQNMNTKVDIQGNVKYGLRSNTYVNSITGKSKERRVKKIKQLNLRMNAH